MTDVETRDGWRHDPWDDPDSTDAILLEHPRRSGRGWKGVVFTLGLLGLVAIVLAGVVGLWYLRKVNPPGDAGAAETFTVSASDNLTTISERLEREGLVSSAGVFRWYVDHNGGLKITPGYYRIRPKDHMGNVMLALSTPPDLTYTKITFPEGFTIEKMGARLEAQTHRLSAAEFDAAATNGSVTSTFLPEGVTSLEGLLFPDTYQVSNGETVTQVLSRMVALMERVGRQEDLVAKAYGQGLSAYQALIIASMVEREAKTPEDRPLIARVILNRLRVNMPLAIDATLSYGQDPSLTFDELKALDTPYNTYLHAGLPPTPIANPGRAAIAAVLDPAPDPPKGRGLCQGVPDDQCHYLYYVLTSKDGQHTFSVTLAQQMANIAAARAAGVLPNP